MSMMRKLAAVRRIMATGLAVGLLTCGGPVEVLAAGPIFWDWPADRPFDEMQLDGAALDRDGLLMAGLASKTAGPLGPEVFWRIIPDGKGGYFTGTGHGGEIHHTSARDKSRLVARLEGSEVFSLMLLDGGDLLAGCGPEGQLYRIDGKGQATLIGSVDGGYIWAMAAEPGSDAVWLASGSPAAVYRFDPGTGSLNRAVDLPAQNALDLVFDAQGALLVATQGPGLVYRLDTDRPAEPRLLYETMQDEVRQFIAGPEGHLFALALNTEGFDHTGGALAPGAGPSAPQPTLMSLMMEGNGQEVPSAALYRLEDDGLVIPWWTGQIDLMIAAWSPRWGWLGGGPLADESGHTVLYGLTMPAGSHPLASWAGGDILDILVAPDGKDGDEIIVCQAHPGSVTVLGERGESPRFAVSPPLDGDMPVGWGRLNWTTNGGPGKLKWSVRSGNRSEPDDTWSDWSDAWTGQNRVLPTEASRFLQWRVEFPTSGRDTSVRLTSVSVSAWQDNLAPMVTSFTQEYLSEIHLGMLNNHNDNITQTFRSGLKAEFSKNSTADRLAEPDRSAVGRSVRVFTWGGTDPNGDRLLWDLAYRRQGEQAWREILAEQIEKLGSWDTAEVPDGTYFLRLTASDRPDNPGHLAAKASRTLGPIVVDNTGPEISRFKIEAVTGGVLLSLTATDDAGVLAGARLRLPDGTTERLDPADGICDSPTEKFSARIDWPRTGRNPGTRPWRFRVEVRDLGGNTTVAEGEVP